MDDIKYTFIIPHYNIPDLLVRCLKSIPDRDDIQIIVCDDHSPNSEDYIDKIPELGRKCVELCICPRNGGAGYARNEGLKKAVGKWLVFADADDFFEDGVLQLLDKYYESSHDVVYFNIRSVYSNDITKEANRGVGQVELFKKYNESGDSTPFRYNYTEPWGKMVKRSLVEENKIKFDETKVCNDYYFSVQVGCLAKTIGVVDSPLYVLTLREGSLCYEFADTKEKLLTRVDVNSRVQMFLEKHGYGYLTPMVNRDLMVILLKKYPLSFIRQLFVLYNQGFDVKKLLKQIFQRKYRQSLREELHA